jgi:hypothetical protein
MDKKKHWETIYESKEPTNASWFQPYLQKSLALMESANLSPNAQIIDVGGGASTFAKSRFQESDRVEYFG